MAALKAEAEKWQRLRGERDTAEQQALYWQQKFEASERKCQELEATVTRLESELQSASMRAQTVASVAAVEAAALAAQAAAASEMELLRRQNQEGEVALAAVQGQV